MRPVWLCPLRLRESDRPGDRRPWPSYPLAPERTYVNVGFWGAVPIGDGRPEQPVNRAIEEKVSELDGHKSLYSEAFYDPRDLRPALRRREPRCGEEALRPGRTFDQSLRQGGATKMTQMKDQPTTLANTRLNLAEIFETLLAGPAPIRFTAYDGSSYGPGGRAGRPEPEERARPLLPGDRARRPRAWHAPTSRATSTSSVSTPATPTRHGPAAPLDAVPSAVAGRGGQPAPLHRAEPAACRRRHRRRSTCRAGAGWSRASGTARSATAR